MKYFFITLILCIAFCDGAKAQFEDDPRLLPLPANYTTDKEFFKEYKKLADNGDHYAQYVICAFYARQAYENGLLSKAKKERKYSRKYLEKVSQSKDPDILYSALRAYQSPFGFPNNTINFKYITDTWKEQQTGGSFYKLAYEKYEMATIWSKNRYNMFVPDSIIITDKSIDKPESYEEFYSGTTNYSNLMRTGFLLKRELDFPVFMESFDFLQKAKEKKHKLSAQAIDTLTTRLRNDVKYTYNIKESLTIMQKDKLILYSFYGIPLIGTDWFQKCRKIADKRSVALCIKEATNNFNWHLENLKTPNEKRKRSLDSIKKNAGDAAYNLGWWLFVNGQQKESLMYMKQAAELGDEWAKLHLDIINKYGSQL